VPAAGCGCPPVIAVVPLSRTTTVSFVPLYAASASAGRPACTNVESPITATTGAVAPDRATPIAIPMLEPIATQLSIAPSGGIAASV
jgi:hypothetical protein